jgi:hypothetical protein
MIEGRVIFSLPFRSLVNQNVSPEITSDIIEIINAIFSFVICPIIPYDVLQASAEAANRRHVELLLCLLAVISRF